MGNGYELTVQYWPRGVLPPEGWHIVGVELGHHDVHAVLIARDE